MLTPRYRSRRAYLLAALFALLACGKTGDHYAPLPDKPETPTSMVVAGLVRDGGDHSVADAVVVIEPTQNGVTATTLNMTTNPGASSESTPNKPSEIAPVRPRSATRPGLGCSSAPAQRRSAPVSFLACS